MKLKTHFKPTFLKAILIAVSFCAFFMFRDGSFKTQKENHKTRTLTIHKAATAVPQEIPAAVPKQSVPAEAITAPLVVEKPSQPQPKKRFTVQRRHSALKKKKLAEAKARRIKEAKLNQIVEEELAVFDTTTDAVNIQSPVADLALEGWEDRSLMSETYLVATSGQEIVTLPAMEQVLTVSETRLQRNDFADIKNSLEAIKEQEKEISLTRLPTAEPENAKNALVTKNEAPKQPVLRKISNVQAAPTEAEAEPKDNAVNPDSGVILNPENKEEETEDEPTLAVPEKKKIELSPMQASAGPELLSSQFVPPSKVVTQKKPATTQTPVSNQTVEDTQYTEANKNNTPDPASPPGPINSDKLFGTLYVDSNLDDWLVSNKGHIELNLHRYGSPNTEDTIAITEYQYPEREFSFDTTNLEGKYQLVANIYSKTGKVPHVQISYPKALSSENFSEKVSFHLAFKQADKPYDKREQKNVLNVTVFEGASGNYRQAKPVEGADIYIVGLESMGRYKTDAEGNVRIANVPPHSELLLDVSAKGFYPTRKIVPVIGTSAYTTVSLLERQKVETVTSYFTKKAQDENKAIIFGRVYDTENRRPLIGDEVSLSGRKGHALYFNAFPDTNLTSSTSTGLFAFMNAEPAFRAVFRSKSDHAMPLDLLPGYGYFADLGRGGKKAIRAVVTDPVQNTVVHGTASTIGSNKVVAESEENGSFTVKDVDLPTGNVTVEFRAKDYPVTWYTLPWDTREAVKTHKLFILEKELIYESAVSFAHVKPEKHKGVLVGGADADFFKGTNRCVRVELLNHKGQALEEEKGPYLLYERSRPADNICLTKSKPGFAFYNLDAGEYILNWRNATGKVLSSQVVRVGTDRLSVVVR